MSGKKAVEFFGLLRHYKGDLGREDGGKGAFVHLEAWQRFVVGSAFGWKRADGLRRFRSVYLEVGKKNGKTLLGAGVMLLLTFFDGEPGAESYSLATKEDQAKLSWNDGAQFVAKNASIARQVRKVGKRLVNERTASFWMPLGRDSDTGDQGINPHSGLVDELHVLDSRDPIDNLETATSSRSQPMIWKITTAGVKRESVWADERADAVAILEGRATDDSVLALVYTLDEGDDPFDEAVWPKANPNLGVSVRVDGLREQAEKAKRSPGKLNAFLRYRMNIPTAVATRAISIEEWDANAGEPVINDGDGCYMGLDLASVRDLTALIGLFRHDDEYSVLCRFWCPEEGIVERSRRDGVPYDDWVRDGYLTATPGNVTDYNYIEEEVKQLAKQYGIGEIGFDKWNATQLSVDLMADGANMVAIPQTHAGLGPAWREFEKLILDRKLRHGGHPILRWMAGNVETETDAQGNQKPSKRHSTERIDGIVALLMALSRWMANGEAPAVWTAA
jgi:phage terminase large subunit-like protein